jgi:hypothetical protein
MGTEVLKYQKIFQKMYPKIKGKTVIQGEQEGQKFSTLKITANSF